MQSPLCDLYQFSGMWDFHTQTQQAWLRNNSTWWWSCFTFENKSNAYERSDKVVRDILIENCCHFSSSSVYTALINQNSMISSVTAENAFWVTWCKLKKVSKKSARGCEGGTMSISVQEHLTRVWHHQKSEQPACTEPLSWAHSPAAAEPFHKPTADLHNGHGLRRFINTQCRKPRSQLNLDCLLGREMVKSASQDLTQ